MVMAATATSTGGGALGAHTELRDFTRVSDLSPEAFAALLERLPGLLLLQPRLAGAVP
jgi:hypothetical protein